jgi:hypothetical protein
VIETKLKVPFTDLKFDPYSKDMIKQASGYAVDTKGFAEALNAHKLKEKREMQPLAAIAIAFLVQSLLSPFLLVANPKKWGK